MNSINQQQPEKNHQGLAGKDAIDKIKELSDKATSCFFCTNVLQSGPLAVRPMGYQAW